MSVNTQNHHYLLVKSVVLFIAGSFIHTSAFCDEVRVGVPNFMQAYQEMEKNTLAWS